MNSEIMFRKKQWYLPTIALFLTLVWASFGFSQQVVEFRTAGRVTDNQIETLKSHGFHPDQLDDFRRLVSNSSGDVQIAIDKTQGIPSHVRADPRFPSEITQPEEQGYYFFEQFNALYKMKDPRRELRPTRARKGRLENYSVRYQQYHEGIKVVSATFVVNVKLGGKLWFVQSRYVPDIDISTEPRVDGATAAETVRSDFVSRWGTNVEFNLFTPELGILNPWVFDRTLESRNILIWVVLAKMLPAGPQWTYHIDATDGRILDVQSSIRSIDSEIWDARGSIDMGDDELWFEDNLPSKKAPLGNPRPETTDLNTFVTDYWDYLHNTFGIHSIDSNDEPEGKMLVARAYWEGQLRDGKNVCGCPNSYWDCMDDEAVFCPGRVRRDIVAHELTHGLIEHSAGGLVHANQSGALHESFCDVFGEFVDCLSGAGNCTWCSGGDCIQSGVRDLQNPVNMAQQPDYVGSTGNPLKDHPLWSVGDVHRNDGVPNIVANLIANGTTSDDPHYNYHVRALGLSKTEQLYYSTLVDAGLGETADFREARNVMDAVCWYFFSNNKYGFTARDCWELSQAWASVGVGTAYGDVTGNIAFPNFAGGFYFIHDHAQHVSDWTFLIYPNTDIYFFPNAKLTATGPIDADGTFGVSPGPINFFSSRGNSGGYNGLRLLSQLKLRNGGEIKLPVNTYESTDTRPRAIRLQDAYIDSENNTRWSRTESFIRIDESFILTGGNVAFNITHGRSTDLSVELISPIGTSVSLSAPQTSLTDLSGENAHGYWTLRVWDYVPGTSGTLNAWSLTLNR